MLVSTMLDPVIGLDFHLVGIPASPSPVPIPTLIPMAFVGIVFDPVGMAVCAAVSMAAGGGPGLVLINGMPVTNTGTHATNVLTMPHLPAPGVMFMKPPCPSNDAQLLFGSLGVTMGGSLAVRLGDIALSCSDPVRLPTSIVLAVPKGAPVLVLRPPVPDLKGMAIAAGIRAGIRALARGVRAGGKAFRALRNAQKRSAGWGRASQGVRRAIDHIAPQRYRDRLKSAVCFVTGHPVDVATGRVFTECVDFALPGPLPLEFGRVYSSSLSWRNGPLGHGWSHTLDQAVWCERGKIVYRADDGREIEFLLGDLKDRIIRPGETIYDPTNRLTLKMRGERRWEIEGPDGLVHHFEYVEGDDLGMARLQRIATKDGHAVECHYDDRQRLCEVIDSGGRKLRFVYDGRDKLRELWLPHETEGSMRFIKYSIDKDLDLERVTDALGHSQTLAYKDHLLVKETDRTGLSFYFQYDGNSPFAKCVRTWGDGGIFDHLIHYDEPNRKTFVVDSLGACTVYQRDELGQIIAVTDPMQKTTRYAYDPESGQETSVLDPLGRETKHEFDARGNVVAVVQTDGTRITFEYENGQPVRVIDEIGNEWRFEYNEAGRIHRSTDPIGAETTYHWQRGLLRSVRDAMGAVIEYDYDRAKNVRKIKYPNGGDERFVHDVCGRVIEFGDPLGGITKCKRDACGRIVEVFEPDGNHRQMKYDAEGNLIEAVDHARHVKFAYGGFHKPVRREEAGQTVTIRYDTEDRMTTIVNEAGEEHTFMRDACGRVLAERHFDNRRFTRYLRDAAGQVERVMRPSGKIIRYERDALGRVTAVSTPDGKTERYVYRADGVLVDAINESVHVKMERDALGRVVREEQGPHSIKRRYDLRGCLTEMSSSLGFDAAFLRDPMGAIEAFAMGTGIDRWQMSIKRDKAGLEKERRMPGGITVRSRRDRMGRVKETSFLDKTDELRRIRYSWDPGDLLKERDDSRRGKATYFHDRRARLTGSDEPGLGVLWRRPTESGNIQQALESDPQEYGTNGALLRSNGIEYRYDFDGNRIAAIYPDQRRETYTWDDLGRLVEVRGVDNSVVRFAYDALGRRVKKTSAKDELLFVWDGDVVLHELSLHVAPITWMFEPGTFSPLAKVHGLRRYAIVADQVGAPIAVFDEWGGIAWQGAVDVFGRAQVDIEKTAIPWRFPGQYGDDETGLVYNRFRYYDPDTGAYIGKDPIGLLGGLNAYGYVDDPLLMGDPLGLAPQPFTRPISWPSWKNVPIDMKEVSSGHMPGGWRLAPGNHKDIFQTDWSQDTVERAIRQAYRNVDSLVDMNKDKRRILLEGPGRGYRVQFWYDKDSRMITTAYPKGPTKCGK